MAVAVVARAEAMAVMMAVVMVTLQ